MRRKLAEIGAGIIVALNQNRAVRRDGDIPADMADFRNDQSGLLRKSNGLRQHRELIADKADFSVRVRLIDVEVIIRLQLTYLSFFRIDTAYDTALT